MALKISAKITLFFDMTMPYENILGLQTTFPEAQFCNVIIISNIAIYLLGKLLYCPPFWGGTFAKLG
jgi:hypothetical protein